MSQAALGKPAEPGTGAGIGSLIFIGLPLFLLLACLAGKFGIVELPGGLRVAISSCCWCR
jgi:hypothetical protein